MSRLKGKLGELLQNLRSKPGRDNDPVTLDPWDVRGGSMSRAERMGYVVSTSLPLLDGGRHVRSSDEVFARMICTFVAAACSYGFDRQTGLNWLEKEGLAATLTAREIAYLNGDDSNEKLLQNEVESLYVLAWSLGYVKRLSYYEASDEGFFEIFPNLQSSHSAEAMRVRARLRPANQVFQQLDLAYCIQSSILKAQADGKRIPGDVHPAVVDKRLATLDWLLGVSNWDEIHPISPPHHGSQTGGYR